jgi:hypothetical protein
MKEEYIREKGKDERLKDLNQRKRIEILRNKELIKVVNEKKKKENLFIGDEEGELIVRKTKYSK